MPLFSEIQWPLARLKSLQGSLVNTLMFLNKAPLNALGIKSDASSLASQVPGIVPPFEQTFHVSRIF